MRRREPTDDWNQLVLLFEWPEQKEYEEIRSLVLFGGSVADRSRETGTPERTMYRKVERFEKDGPRGLFSTEGAKRQVLPPAIRRMIVDLKAEHPTLNNNEIGNIVYARTGRRLGKAYPCQDPRRGVRASEALAFVRALPQDGGREGGSRGGGGATPRRLEGEVHRLLHEGQPDNRLQGLGAVGRGRRRGP
jgi:hypothetical protein